MERKLVERAMHGDEAAFDALIGRVGDQLHSVARRILRDPYLAEDALQQTLITVWNELPRLRDPDRFEAWLYRLTTNACLDLLRRRKRRSMEVELEPMHDPPTADIAGPIADRELLDRALRRLDPEWRVGVVLHYFVGLSVPEVSAITGVPLGTVKSRLHRAVAQLRDHVVADLAPTGQPAEGGQLA